ncbi:MAG: GAF domain-containing protein [Deltaproteobacteria bacterium]|nr:GAF domain-containing protein [Deltaproteobacteria bacterium]
MNGITARLQEIIWTSISITLLFLSVAFLVTYIAAKRITGPLLRLKQGVEAIEEGGAYERLDIDAVDEIGHLAASFNLMVGSLKKKDEEIMRHVQELSALNSVACAVNQSLDLQSTMQDALKEVLEVTGMKAGWIYLPNEDSSLFKVAAHKGVDDRFVKKIDLLEPGEGIAGKVAISGKPIMQENISGDPRISRGAVWDEGFKAFASLPLSSKETTLGVMNIASYDTHPFTPDEADLLHSIGGLIGTAIENSMLYERVKKQLEEIERAQDKLVRTARLASLGELSANVAHEINNPLTGVLTHTSMLMDDMPDTDPGQKRLHIIYDETMRIRYIVRNLLDFARQTEPRMEVVSVVDVIKDTLNLVSHLAKVANVRIVEEYRQDNSPLVSIDVAQMKQVLLNLFNNAFHAMPDGGDLKIDVTTSNGWANIHIKDTGCGIPKEIINKVFDPFFTTKPGTKGTGLGLSVSHGIIEKHGGKIEVESVHGYYCR